MKWDWMIWNSHLEVGRRLLRLMSETPQNTIVDSIWDVEIQVTVIVNGPALLPQVAARM